MLGIFSLISLNTAHPFVNAVRFCLLGEAVMGVQALDKMSDKAFPEFAPFAATLAQKLVKFVKSGQLAPGQPLWKLAVDQFLLRAVDTETQVRFPPILSFCHMWPGNLML